MTEKDNEKLKNLLLFNAWVTGDEIGQLGCLLALVLIGAALFLWWYSN